MYTAREMADMAETLARWEVNAENVSPLWNRSQSVKFFSNDRGRQSSSGSFYKKQGNRPGVLRAN